LTVTWLFIALALLATGAAGLAGGLLREGWLKRHSPGLIGFAAGALLGAAFLDVLPESVEALGSVALIWAFAGFVASTVIEWLLGHHHQHEQRPATLPATLLTSDALHNLADGGGDRRRVPHFAPGRAGGDAGGGGARGAAGAWRLRAAAARGVPQAAGAAVAGGGAADRGGRSAERAARRGPLRGGDDGGAVGGGGLLPLPRGDRLAARGALRVHSGRTPGERRERLFGLLGGISLLTLASFAGA
jgi:hypothetical protein